jgi:hypothetical protein
MRIHPVSRSSTSFALLAAALLLMIPGGAVGQERASLERLETWACAKADADGDSFRPGFCDPRCDCFSPTAISSVSSCSETVPGTFEAEEDNPGTCGAICEPAEWLGGTITFCSDSSFASCPTDTCADPLEECLPVQGGSDACVREFECTSDAQCNGGGPAHCENASSLPVCGIDGDCARGSTCTLVVGGGITHCEPITCTQDSDCDLPPVTLTLAGVSTADDTSPVSCSQDVYPVPVQNATISSNDALECITQVEAVIGQACTPAP